MKKRLLQVCALSALLFLNSCMATTHIVGTGGKGDGRPGHYDTKQKQIYLFWGLLPLSNVDSKKLAGGATNYTVRTTTSFGDGIINSLGELFFGLRTQTIRVSKGDK